MAKHAAGFPPELASRRIRVLRPRDATKVYAANPSAELVRLAERGLLRRVASGYYVIVPADRVGDGRWRPPLVATAWAIAAVDYGVDSVAVCGPSAARYHGLIPRELAVAFVAVPKQRPKLSLLGGEAHFIRRDVERLDVERWTSGLGDGRVTTLEQTALDLAARRYRWVLPENELEEAIAAALPRLDRARVDELGRTQGQGAAAKRLLARLTSS
jgi:predicted transcriptional regulator of viral defense system